MPVIHWNREDEDGAEETISFPARWEICERCRGEGHHDHPAFSNGITSSEWNSWDDDDRDNYLSGRYDVCCDECKGSGKVMYIDEDACTGDLAKELKAYREYQEEMYQHWRMCEAERRMGA